MSLRFITKSDKRILTASVFLFFLVFASVLWLELTSVQQSKQALLQSEVKSLAFVVDKVLGDARLAIAQAQPLLGQPCNTTLEKSSILSPHATRIFSRLTLRRAIRFIVPRYSTTKGTS